MLNCVVLHLKEVVHYVVHLCSIGAAGYYWFQHSVLKDVLEDKLERRHNEKEIKMNFLQGVVLAEEEAVKLNTFLAKLPTYLPLIQKNIADLQKAVADKNDPTALLADSSALLGDLNSDLAILATIVPAPTVPVVTPAVTPPPAA